jgi:hypothetical protein
MTVQAIADTNAIESAKALVPLLRSYSNQDRARPMSATAGGRRTRRCGRLQASGAALSWWRRG